MVPTREVRDKLDNLTDVRFKEFGKKIPYPCNTRESALDVFRAHPDLEAIFCEHLDLDTQEEKQIHALDNAAKATRNASCAAWVSAVAACIAIVVSSVALFCRVTIIPGTPPGPPASQTETQRVDPEPRPDSATSRSEVGPADGPDAGGGTGAGANAKKETKPKG